MFRLAEDPDSALQNLIKFNENEGRFNFTINSPSGDKTLSILLEQGEDPRIDDNTNLRFHVFNSDYVRDNLVNRRYIFNGDINGYVIGKRNAELEELEKRIDVSKETLQTRKKVLEKRIEQMKADLKAAGVRSNMNELSSINVEKILNVDLPLTHQYQAALTQCRSLKSIEEDPSYIEQEDVPAEHELLSRIETILTTQYSRSHFSNEFKANISREAQFFSKGVALLNGSREICPFCEQRLSPTAIELIDQYEAYLHNEETRAIQETKDCKDSLQQLKDNIIEWGRLTYLSHSELKSFVELYPALATTKLPPNPGSDQALDAIQQVYGALDEKLNDISAAIDAECAISLRSALEELKLYTSTVKKLLPTVNKARHDSGKALRDAKRNLCTQAIHKLRIDEDETVKDIRSIQHELIGQEKRRDELLGETNTSRKDIVAETLKTLLYEFFGDRYTFDKETFHLVLGDHEISDDAVDILSDGEKSIVAFCYYLASTCECIEHASQWEKLFFVIDDPISSMDFNYVYMMAQCIRSLGNWARGKQFKHDRVLILTHNPDFFDILASNGIAKNMWILDSGNLRKTSETELLPFEEHLYDILRVAENGEQPTHTTGNSIRHTLEWAWHILEPAKHNVREFCDSVQVLRASAFIYSLCNNESHASLRRKQNFDEEIIRACQIVTEFMTKEFCGQVDKVRKRFDVPESEESNGTQTQSSLRIDGQ